MVIIRLIKEYVFAISTICGEVFENPIGTDAVFQTQLLPEFRPNCEMHEVKRYIFAHALGARSDNALWLPHCPT